MVCKLRDWIFVLVLLRLKDTRQNLNSVQQTDLLLLGSDESGYDTVIYQIPMVSFLTLVFLLPCNDVSEVLFDVMECNCNWMKQDSEVLSLTDLMLKCLGLQLLLVESLALDYEINWILKIDGLE